MIIKSLWERVFKGNEPSSSFRKAIVTNKYEKQGRVFLKTLGGNERYEDAKTGFEDSKEEKQNDRKEQIEKIH